MSIYSVLFLFILTLINKLNFEIECNNSILHGRLVASIQFSSFSFDLVSLCVLLVRVVELVPGARSNARHHGLEHAIVALGQLDRSMHLIDVVGAGAVVG